MEEKFLNIPTTLLPSANEGEIFIGRFEVRSVDHGIAQVVLSSADFSESESPPSKKNSVPWADRIAERARRERGNDLREKAETDERLAHILNKHAPGYLD